jgi:hypothetical protein
LRCSGLLLTALQNCREIPSDEVSNMTTKPSRFREPFARYDYSTTGLVGIGILFCGEEEERSSNGGVDSVSIYRFADDRIEFTASTGNDLLCSSRNEGRGPPM